MSRGRLSFANRMRFLAGRFNLTDFEKVLIDAFLEAARPEMARVIRMQLAKSNRVRRLLQDDDRLECGSTTFYWHRFGKSRLNELDCRLPYDDGSTEKVVGCCYVTDSEGRKIEANLDVAKTAG